jgi:hypothetical protein
MSFHPNARILGAIVDPACAACRGRREGIQIYSSIRLKDKVRMAWDVELALQLVSDGRTCVTVHPALLNEMLRVNQVDPGHLDHVDPSIPGIACVVDYTPRSEPIVCLIDGSHRAARCRRDGLPFRACALTAEESLRCQQTSAVELFLQLDTYQSQVKERQSMPAVLDANCPECQEKRQSPRVYTFERFDQKAFAWAIDLAIAICADGRDPVPVLPEHLNAILSVNEINTSHLDHVNPYIPGIACVCGYAGVQPLLVLIDGSHRAARCRRDGIPFFVYFLSEEESQRCQEHVPELLTQQILRIALQ